MVREYNTGVILNVYKEINWTSHDVVAKLRSVLGTKKIGHAGTLDPLAEGVLIVLTDKDTKSQEKYMGMEKEYLAEIAFGAKSPTYDLEGDLSIGKRREKSAILKAKLESVLFKYGGKFEQKVSPFSAVKVGGEKLYEKARKGEIRKLPAREVEVKEIKLELFEEKEIQGNFLPVATLKIVCSKGFYVRSLAHDLGEELKVGGVLTKLIRTRVGDYRVEDAKRINEINS